MSHAGSTVCEVHGEGYNHRPTPFDIERHHVWPVGMGGPDVPENIVLACPTGHSDIHALLRMMLRHPDGTVPWEVARRFGVSERAYARQGWLAVKGDPDVRARLGG